VDGLGDRTGPEDANAQGPGCTRCMARQVKPLRKRTQ
jgi:hypothetical protein